MATSDYDKAMKLIAWNTPLGCGRELALGTKCTKDKDMCNLCLSVQYLRESCNECAKEMSNLKSHIRKTLRVDNDLWP